MKTATKLTLLILFLAWGATVSRAQAEQKLAASEVQTETQSCAEWFFQFPQPDERGKLMEITEARLRDPHNLKPGRQDWLQHVEVPAFKENFYGTKVAGLTLYYDPCRKIASIAKYDTPEELAHAEAAAGAASQPAASLINPVPPPPTPTAANQANPACNPDESWSTVYHGKSGRAVPFDKLVKDKKLTKDEADKLRGSEAFLNVAEAYGTEFSIRKNACDSSFRILPTSVTTRVEESGTTQMSGGQKGPSKVQTFAGLAGSGASAYFAIAGSTAGMMVAGPAAFAAVPIYELIKKLVRKKKPADGRQLNEQVDSKIRYALDGSVLPGQYISAQTADSRGQPRQAKAQNEYRQIADSNRDGPVFNAKGDWWKKGW